MSTVSPPAQRSVRVPGPWPSSCPTPVSDHMLCTWLRMMESPRKRRELAPARRMASQTVSLVTAFLKGCLGLLSGVHAKRLTTT
eukprot:6795915-Prymnesium_polylepis.1